MFVAVLLAVCAYLIGSVPAALWVSRLRGLPDPRTFGSGNPGATNVLRSGDRVAAILTLAADLLKGAWPAVLARVLDLGDGAAAAAGSAAVAGHVFPVFYGFRGGKGVATALGGLLGFSPLAAAAALGVFGATVAATRFVSVGSIAAALSAPGWLLLFGATPPAVGAYGGVALLIGWRHRENLRRLSGGREPRFGGGSAERPGGVARRTGGE
jgi:glycerol-3-phosphate acyltransferase PlsY